MAVAATPSLGRAAVAVLTGAGVDRLRAAGGLLIFGWLLWAAFGLAWDVRSHSILGRDSFWSAAHLMLYSGVLLAGLTCIGLTLVETWRFHRRDPAVTTATTTAFLGVFHAPLGVLVSGLGLAVMAGAAPLDNYWHSLYGLDVVLWAPFHVMGLIGGALAMVGLVQLAASERVRAPAAVGRLVVGVAFGMLLLALLSLISPGLTVAPSLVIGELQVTLYPLLLAAVAGFAALAALASFGRPGVATLAGSFNLAFSLVAALVVPWLIWWSVSAATPLRNPDWTPSINWGPLLQAALVLLPLLAADALGWFLSKREGNLALAGRHVPALAGATGLAAITAGLLLLARSQAAAATPLLPAFARPLPLPPPEATLLALPLALLVALLAGWIGFGWGRFLARYPG